MEGYDVDRCALHIRCEPKTVYKFDDQLLRNRWGRAYYSILEPDTQKMKAYHYHPIDTTNRLPRQRQALYHT